MLSIFKMYFIYYENMLIVIISRIKLWNGLKSVFAEVKIIQCKNILKIRAYNFQSQCTYIKIFFCVLKVTKLTIFNMPKPLKCCYNDEHIVYIWK